MVAAWDDVDWISSELERMSAHTDRRKLGTVQADYRALLVARAMEIGAVTGVLLVDLDAGPQPVP